LIQGGQGRGNAFTFCHALWKKASLHLKMATVRFFVNTASHAILNDSNFTFELFSEGLFFMHQMFHAKLADLWSQNDAHLLRRLESNFTFKLFSEGLFFMHQTFHSTLRATY